MVIYSIPDNTVVSTFDTAKQRRFLNPKNGHYGVYQVTAAYTWLAEQKRVYSTCRGIYPLPTIGRDTEVEPLGDILSVS